METRARSGESADFLGRGPSLREHIMMMLKRARPLLALVHKTMIPSYSFLKQKGGSGSTSSLSVIGKYFWATEAASFPFPIQALRSTPYRAILETPTHTPISTAPGFPERIFLLQALPGNHGNIGSQPID